MTERERILDKMSLVIREVVWNDRFVVDGDPDAVYKRCAEAALQVIEAPRESVEEYSAICTCGQSGYPENSPHSNHPHRDGCPQEKDGS